MSQVILSLKPQQRGRIRHNFLFDCITHHSLKFLNLSQHKLLKEYIDIAYCVNNETVSLKRYLLYLNHHLL